MALRTDGSVPLAASAGLASGAVRVGMPRITGLADSPMTNEPTVAKIWVSGFDGGGRAWIACGRSPIGSTLLRAILAGRDLGAMRAGSLSRS